MAKGTKNLSGRRSSSRNARPYDANNSFVKKVATKVTDLIPQRSWISKWFNSSQNEGDVLVDTENPEQVESEEDIQKPPPSKRPCIRMDVTYPSGTFVIQPRAKAPLNKTSPSKLQYSIHNETSEDFSVPVMAGPSGTNLISSTPAIQTDIRNITPQRADLNSLVVATNNGATNGTDDNSESSESTSGCSSLIPQTNRQEAPSNVSYNSPFSNKKRFINEKLTFTNHTQSPRSLFLDSNRDTLSSRRPSFNASMMTNTPDHVSPLSSPFYSGNITFGGANAADLYKRGRCLFNSSNEIQLKVPRRTRVEVKPLNISGIDSSGMSQTAKKILEALEHFSSPVTDAKKIPLKMLNNTSMYKKRAREEILPTKVGLRHLTRELTVPTIPDILKLRRRQKLQDTTLVARKIVSARSEPPPPQEYHIRTQGDEDSKHLGKIKTTATNFEQEEAIQPVNLPCIPLPITSLPNFNFMPVVNLKSSDKTPMEETFTFASPIKVTNVTNTLKSINNFTFSSPLNADKQSIDRSSNSSSPLKRSGKAVVSSTNCIASVTQNFVWYGSSTAPRPKENIKKADNIVPATSKDLKSGSVMDILSSKSAKIEPQKSSNTKVQDSTDNKEKTITSGTSKDLVKTVNLKSGLLQDTSSMWECSECLIKNSNSETQCFACKTAKPNPKDNKICELPSTLSNANDSNPGNNKFGSEFKLSSDQWECSSCYLRNKQTDDKCVACNALKLNSIHKANSNIAKLSNSDINNVVDSVQGPGECSKCILKIIGSSIVCSCSASKSSPKRNEDSNDLSTSTNQKTLNNLVVKNEIMEKFKPGKDTWECPCCMVRNAASVDTCPCCNTTKPSTGGTMKTATPLVPNGFGDKFKKPEGAWNCDICMLQNEAKATECVACGGLKPGIKKSDNSSTNVSSSLQFNFGMPSITGGFNFGIDKANQQKTESITSTSTFKFGASQPSSQASQFTFGVQKEQKMLNETLKTGNTTIESGFGLQAKNSEKTKIKQVSEKPMSAFSFGIPKTENLAGNNKPVTTSSSTTLPATFTFGVPKPETKKSDIEKQSSLFGNTMTQVSESTTGTTESTVTSGNALITSPNSSQEIKPAGIFAFGVPNSTTAVCSVSTSVVTSLPSSTQSSFAFPETKLAQTSIPTFNQLVTSTPASSSNTFTFGESKTAEGGLATKTFGALPNGSGNSIFSSVSSTPSLFDNTDAKTIPAFGTKENKQATFVANPSKPSPFAIPENKVATFGNAESKPSIFGSSDAKLPVFGCTDTKTTSLFNSTPQTPAATFSASSTTPSTTLFGSSATPIFGSSGSTFVSDAKSNMFGSTSKPDETNTPSSNLFTFSATPQPVAQSGTGFNFSGNANPSEGSTQKPLFTFGSGTSTSQSGNVFGSTFNTPASNTSGFTFNAPKPEIPTFGQSTVPPLIFGVTQAASQNQHSSSFTPSSSTGFNFGSTVPATSSGGFNFGASTSNPTSSTGFNFNAPSTTPTFDPNTPPSYNFTGGNAPVTFNGTPQAVRKIKKAFRRVR
ncbi:PREDICTED: nuclear pore complex protein Nup153 [Dufourea novaeangliae]|uniref:nuclear pore complex protein Nup153 n=1 Tax=Dufourea novaeangliae TaxID=178035 RepID=UPI000766FC09|nr:PREDICTED: nuclear pore complex protein Nup153 [Dufourea novaeangliae]